MAEKDNRPQELPQQHLSAPHKGGVGNLPEKSEWPELVGLTAEEAERKIKEEMAEARVQVVRPDWFVTMDFRTDRVRIYVDSSGKVVKPPRIG